MTITGIIKIIPKESTLIAHSKSKNSQVVWGLFIHFCCGGMLLLILVLLLHSLFYYHHNNFFLYFVVIYFALCCITIIALLVFPVVSILLIISSCIALHYYEARGNKLLTKVSHIHFCLPDFFFPLKPLPHPPPPPF